MSRAFLLDFVSVKAPRHSESAAARQFHDHRTQPSGSCRLQRDDVLCLKSLFAFDDLKLHLLAIF